MNPPLCRALLLAGLITLPAVLLRAQDAGPGDFDFKLVPSTKSLHQGDDVSVDALVSVRKAGAQGWSYGVTHDAAVLDVTLATKDGGDVPSVFQNGFEQTAIITENGKNVGWMQAVILSLTDPKELPVKDGFVMAKSTYKVLSGICGGKTEVPTSIAFTDKIVPSPGSPAVDINVTVNGKAIIPAVLQAGDLSIQC